MINRTGYKLRKPRWPWRNYLTDDERTVIERADAAKREWLKINRERAGIQNRAIQRAKHAAQQRPISLTSALKRAAEIKAGGRG